MTFDLGGLLLARVMVLIRISYCLAEPSLCSRCWVPGYGFYLTYMTSDNPVSQAFTILGNEPISQGKLGSFYTKPLGDGGRRGGTTSVSERKLLLLPLEALGLEQGQAHLVAKRLMMIDGHSAALSSTLPSPSCDECAAVRVVVRRGAAGLPATASSAWFFSPNRVS